MSELAKLSAYDKYKGNDKIHNADASGMKIKHVDHVIVPTQTHALHLNNVLHVSQATKKNLISVHCLAKDNYTFLEFHRDCFLIKD